MTNITLKIEAELSGEKGKPGKLFLTSGDCTSIVSDKDDTKLGRIAGTIGGGLELADERTGKRFYLSNRAIWEAFQEALESEAAQ